MKKDKTNLIVGYVTVSVVMLTLLFLMLKVTGVIAWSWFLVFSPILLLIGLILASLILTWMIVYTAIGLLMIYEATREDEEEGE